MSSREMAGRLFVYGSEAAAGPLVAFESGPTPSTGAHGTVVFLGGLSDGLLCTPYVDDLGHALERVGVSLVQVVLRSSYGGYGVCRCV